MHVRRGDEDAVERAKARLMSGASDVGGAGAGGANEKAKAR
jgi:hypothetical protein